MKPHRTDGNKIRLLFIIDSLVLAGAERQLVELVKGLDKSLYAMHIICLAKSPTGYYKTVEDMGIPIHYFLAQGKIGILTQIVNVSRFIQAKKIDIVHTMLNLGSVVGVVAAKYAGVPTVCCAIQEAKDINWKYTVSKRILAPLSDYYVSNSKAGFINRFKKWRPHFRVIYNGVDFSRFQITDVSDLRHELGLDKFDAIIGMVGNLSNYKDHETFLKMASLILVQRPRTGFLLVGEGSKRDALQSMVQALGIGDKVIFAGHRDDVDRIYGLLTVMVLLTNPVIEEGISNAIIEAMAMKVPVVATRGGGTPELIRHGETGFMVKAQAPEESADTVLKILSSTSLAASLAEQANIFVRKQFALDRYVAECEQLYHDVLTTR